MAIENREIIANKTLINLMKHLFYTAILLAICLGSCKKAEEKKTELLHPQADKYLTSYSEEFKKLVTASNEAEWKLNTKIQEGDTITQKEYETAAQELTKFTGSVANIDSAKKYLAMSDKLSPIQKRQMEYILFLAGGAPATASETVNELIKVKAEQTKVLYGFDFKIDGKS